MNGRKQLSERRGARVARMCAGLIALVGAGIPLWHALEVWGKLGLNLAFGDLYYLRDNGWASGYQLVAAILAIGAMIGALIGLATPDRRPTFFLVATSSALSLVEYGYWLEADKHVVMRDPSMATPLLAALLILACGLVALAAPRPKSVSRA